MGGQGYYDFPPPLFIAGDKAIIVYPVQESKSQIWILAVSLETGEIAWKTRHQGVIERVDRDTERIYVLSSYHITAYRSSDGKRLWQSEEFPAQTYYQFYEWGMGNPLRLYSNKDTIIFLDPLTGETLGQNPYPFFMQYGRFDFFYEVLTNKQAGTSTRMMWVVDHETNQRLWSREIVWRRLMQPVFSGEDMLYLDGKVIYDILRVNLQTGEDRWKTTRSRYISNFALVGSSVYLLDRQGSLVALDANNGQEIGRVSFNGPPPQELGTYPYWVAADAQFVLVYFGDTEELIALKVTE